LSSFFVFIIRYNYVTGKTFDWALSVDVTASIDTIRYYAGWADKLTGQTLEVCLLSFRQ
jgi:acyl-CoA reductase-like NAD-dependent aldehyde dehydrogenase